MMRDLANINATLVRTNTGKMGRRPTILLPPDLSRARQKAVEIFELTKWMPTLDTTRIDTVSRTRKNQPL